MVRWTRFEDSQAWRPTPRGGCIDRGGWVKKARTNKPNVAGGGWESAMNRPESWAAPRTVLCAWTRSRRTRRSAASWDKFENLSGA